MIVIVFSILDPKLWFELYPFPAAGVLNKYVFSWLNISPFWNGFIARVYSDFLDMISGSSVFVVGPMWFLWSLFWCTLVFAITFYLFRNKKWIILAYTIIAGILGWIFYTREIALPFNLDVILTSLLFYGMGFVLKSFVDTITLISKDRYFKLLFLLLLIFIWGYINNGRIEINGNKLGQGNFLEFSSASLGGSLLLVVLFARFITQKVHLLSFVAQNAIQVLALHMWILYCIIYFFPDMNAFLRFIIVCILTFASIPIANKYLYFLFGNKQMRFTDTFIKRLLT